MRKSVFLLGLLLGCVGCSSMRFATSERWEWHAESGRVAAADTPLFFQFGDSGTVDIMNLQNCYQEPTHFVTAENADGNNTLPYIQHALNDLPFRVDSVLCVLGEQIVIFEQASPAQLAPDYVMQSDSVVMNMHGEVFRPSSQQRADVFWRNIFVNKREKRVVCLDRFYINRRHICVLYILQSASKTLRTCHAANWWGFHSCDITDPRNIMLTAVYLEGWQWQSIGILNEH